MEKLKALSLQAPRFKYEPLQPNCTYHVYNHTNGDEVLFRCQANYEFFLKQYSLFIAPIADTLCYCLMPNHFHFVVRIKSEPNLAAFFEGIERLKLMRQWRAAGYDDRFIPISARGSEGFTACQIEKLLSKQFANFFSSYTQAFNKTYMRMGSLFMKNFKRKMAANNLYLKTLILYIHLNPVKSALCLQAGDWPFSSFNSISSNDNFLVKADEVIDLFDDTEHFKTTHRYFESEEI